MTGKRYTDEFKIEAVKQITERGYSVSKVAERLGITPHSLYNWLKKHGGNDSNHKQVIDHQTEIRKLKSELRRVTEERDILKKATAYFAKESR